MIVIIDYKAGNLASIQRSINKLGYKSVITQDADVIIKSERIIFPGVGAAPEAMKNMERYGIKKALVEYVKKGKPLLGICLGSQIILSKSEEGDVFCLDLIKGCVKKFTNPCNGNKIKIPHMGWNQVNFLKSHAVFNGIPNQSEFYFVHSYYPLPDDRETVAADTDYGITFASVLTFSNILATQFHPEKSGEVGLKLLDNFCRWSI
ncbi:MAG: imidazole glycerol phosphate synthase subunit HisH [Elusimicrobiota bacterium]